MNKTARIIIDYCINNDIGTLIVGYNETFQRNSNIGKINNQAFVNIPYGQLRSKLEYLCELNGIAFVKQEESYTSKASFGIKIIFLFITMIILRLISLVVIEYIVVCIKRQMANT